MSAREVKVLSPVSEPVLDLIAPGAQGSARAVVWPGTGATLRSMHLVSLGGGSATRRLVHPTEAVYYVIAGGGRVDAEDGPAELRLGSMIHVGPDTPYAFQAGSDGLELVGGPGPADPSLYVEGG